jgi:hypothetical protein
MKAAFFISDEGFGHSVRQSAIIVELIRQEPLLEIDIYAGNNTTFLINKLGTRVNYKPFDSYFGTKKLFDGSLDVAGTIELLSRYNEFKIKHEIALNKILDEYDVVVSDFVPTVFEIAAKASVPTIGVAHFTWDWLLETLDPRIDGSIVNLYLNGIGYANKLIFPPATPNTMFDRYNSSQIKHCDFITSIHAEENKKTEKSSTASQLKCLLMDNGTSNLKVKIQKIVDNISDNDDITFYAKGELGSHPNGCHKNIVWLESHMDLHRLVSEADIIVARAGFNTVSEVFVFKKFAFLISEGFNPEVKYNLDYCLNRDLALEPNMEMMTSDPCGYLLSNFNENAQRILENLDRANFRAGGEAFVAREISSSIRRL